MAKLSVVISAYNEEEKIKDCLESVKSFADEIIFVDNTSTDQTVDIAKNYTKKIYKRPNNPMLNINKNYGFSKATGDWILNLDADERVTPELTKEIRNLKLESRNSNFVGYWIPRKNILFGKWMQHTGWYPDHQLRLFKKGKGKFPEKHVHEMIEVEGKTDYLSEHILHYNYETVLQFLHKLSHIYTPNEAQQLLEKGYSFNFFDAIRFPTQEFINRFFTRKGYKDGFHGLMLSLFMAFYQFVVFAAIWEKEKFKENNNKNFLRDLHREFQKISYEIKYWFLTIFIDETLNPFKKLFYKLSRKRITKKLKKVK